MRREVLMREVVKGIWLGGWHDCKNQMPTIHIGEECPFRFMDERNRTYDLRDYDEDAPQILQILDECEPFITKWRQVDPGVLVHCTVGVSRSATLVFLYLIRVGEIKTRRDFEKLYPSWFPNMGFQRLFTRLRID